jgi:predicted SnoaL-like aldol condensation-catalyzing enzyme
MRKAPVAPPRTLGLYSFGNAAAGCGSPSSSTNTNNQGDHPMKLLKLAAASAALLLGAQAFAQDPVVGTADEALFTDSDPALHRNKQAALHIMRELLQCNQWSRAGEWLTDAYIQHNPNAASGLAGVIYYFTEVAKRQPTATCDKLTTPIVAVTAEDDLVTVIIPRTYKHPVTGADYTSTWFDTWRFVDGKADEHWDPATIAPPAGN